MQKGKVANGANADGTVNDETVYVPASWNDNIGNLFKLVENAGYTLIDDDGTSNSLGLQQVTKAVQGLYNPSFTYNTSSIVTQAVDDVVTGSDGKRYKALDNGIIGDDPVGSISGNWEVYSPNSIDINDLTEKVTPVDNDIFLIEDSADSFNKKKVKFSSMGGREVATSAEIRTGINNVKVITPLGYNETTLGWGQTWQDVTTSRSAGVTYTNNTGKPIIINSTWNTDGISGYVDGILVASANGEPGLVFGFISMIVPANSTYSVTSSNNTHWAELR